MVADVLPDAAYLARVGDVVSLFMAWSTPNPAQDRVQWDGDGTAWITTPSGGDIVAEPRVSSATLPAHLALHPPFVALLLSLYDVPEIRARVESACP
jgi:hypothetical protein